MNERERERREGSAQAVNGAEAEEEQRHSAEDARGA